MGKRLHRLVELFSTYMQALGYVISALTGATVTGLLARATTWMDPYGPIGWWAAALLGGLVASLIYGIFVLVVAKGRVWRAEKEAIDKWKQQVDSVNPLAVQFQGQRIRLQDIAHPVTHTISNRRFIDCELFGPANVLLIGGGSLQRSSFNDCNIVPLRSGTTIIKAGFIFFEDVEVLHWAIYNCVLFIPAFMVPTFEAMGAASMMLTAIAEPGGALRLPQEPAAGTQP